MLAAPFCVANAFPVSDSLYLLVGKLIDAANAIDNGALPSILLGLDFSGAVNAGCYISETVSRIMVSFVEH